MPANPIVEYPQSGGMQLIQKITATAVASVTFTAIPQGFNNLRLVCNFGITSGANLVIVFNGDTANHYGFGLNFNSNGTPSASANFSLTQPQGIIGGAVGSAIVEIPSYANAPQGVTTVGTFAAITASSNLGGTANVTWTGTDVTSITLKDSGGSALFVAGSTFTLYGY